MQQLYHRRSSPKTKNITFKYIYLLWRQNNLYSYKNYKTCNRKKSINHQRNIQYGMSYLAISSKTGSEMITKIQHQTALWQSVVSLFSAKDHKTNWQALEKYEVCMNTESYWSKVWRWIEDYTCLHGTGLCQVSSQLSSVPQLGCVFFFFSRIHESIHVFSTAEG